MLADLVNHIKNNTPNYNPYLLRGFMAEQVSKAPDFVETMFREAMKLFGGIIQYKGYVIVPPERRAEYEMRPYPGGGVGGCRVTMSDMMLIDYIFVYDGQDYTVPLYIPYIRNDVITIEDTIYVLPHAIKEQAFSRIANGVTIKVIRQPIPFYQTPFRAVSVSDDWYRNEMVPRTVIYNRSDRSGRRRLPPASLIHYLLCKFGYIGTLQRFGLTPEDCIFTMEITRDTDKYRYFNARQTKKKQAPELFLKVRKDKLEDAIVSKFVTSLLYILTSFNRHNVEDLYEPTGIIFRVLLSKIVNAQGVNDIQGERRVSAHISSVDTYLDPITQMRLKTYGIQVNDFYDLLQYVFVEIERLALVSHTNLYHTRIDYLEELIGETIVTEIFSRWYPIVRRLGNTEIDPRKLNEGEIGRILKFSDNLISRLSRSRIVQKSPSLYNDNALVSILSQKIRLSGLSNSGTIIGSPDHRFHTSMVVVDSITTFSKTNPGAAGTINPYLEIDENGSIKRPDYADEIDELRTYLPY